MNRARKKTHKRGTAKRLVRESLILSSTRFLSSRFVRLFESGFASPLIRSVKTVDDFVREKITGPVFNKLGIRKNFAMPARNAVAAFVSRSRAVKRFSSFRAAFLNTSLRSVGIFLLTFGIYAAAIFLLKYYVDLNLGVAANVDDISTAAITVLVGLLLTAFGEKSIINALGGSRIVGSLLSNHLGVNDSSLDRYAPSSSGTSIGFSFLLGSLFGISTLFFTPVSVLLFILAVLAAVAVFHIPEFGLLFGAATFSFVPAVFSSVTIFITFVSYLLKCIRLKRNFRFGSADAAVLLVFSAMSVAFSVSDGGLSSGELYILCFTSVYFLAKNLLCSEKLVVQTFNAFCIGVSIGMTLYIIGDFAELIPHNNFRAAAYAISRYTASADMLAMLVSATLPFALSSFSAAGGRRARKLFIIITLACAFVMDSIMFYVMILVSLFVYIACVYKAPVGALAASAIVIPPVLSVASGRVLSSAVSLGAKTVYDPLLSMPSEAAFANFWTGIYGVGGVITVALFAGALLLILQRIFASTNGLFGNRTALFGGTIAASAVILILCMFIFDPFSDLRMLIPLWFVFGLCGAFYKVSVRLNSVGQEV